MHQPMPYGRFVEGDELSSDDVAAIARFAKEITNFKEVSNLESYKRRTVLPSGRMAVGTNAGGVFRIRVIERYSDTNSPLGWGAYSRVPMLYSGSVTSAVVRDGEGVGLRLTEQARRRLVGYLPNADLPPSDVKLMRFRIEYPWNFRFFEPDVKGIYTFTQFHKLRPTWYSGAMTEVAQVVSGYGRQDLDALPNNQLERAVIYLPKKVSKRIERELRNMRLPGYVGAPVQSGEFVYDFRASLCHGVGFDSENKPWLLRVDVRGVFAMPLPVIPATTTTSFREYIEEKGDSEILALLDRFGGMPSGESFPESESDFEAWRRAGVIIKVCDCADFYSHAHMYDLCGWAFNSRASEGYNTCREWNGQHWTAHAYMMMLKLQSVKNGGMVSASWHLDNPDEAHELLTYLGRINQGLDNSPRSQAIKYKLRRFTGDQLLSIARDVRSTVDYWDNLEMSPVAPHTGTVRRVSTGNLWHPGKIPSAFGAIKFPALQGQGCQSIDVTAPDYTGPAVRCDTVVFGCYVKDQLRTIKYFYEPRETKKTEESTFEEPMIVGTWEKTTTEGMTGLDGKVYTTDSDDRRERSPSVTTTKVIGTDKGYGEPAWHTPALLTRVGTLSRARYYEHRTEVTTEYGQSLVSSATVPVFARDCILYAMQKGAEHSTETIDTDFHGIADPTSYEFWTHDDIFHYMGVTTAGNMGEPKPKLGAPVWLDSMLYTPSAGSDFADSGDWYGFSPPMNVTGVVGHYTARNSPHNGNGVVVGGMAPGWEPFHSESAKQGEVTGRVNAVMPFVGAVPVHRRRPDDWFFLLSPVDAGGLAYFYRDASWIAFGESGYASVSELGVDGMRVFWGKSTVADRNSANGFIGVINE
ncbi:hypothetical protein LZ683_08960 [Comamonas testosteroni]|uniref:hypothetical protein n=1 Tax=Comamonas testosteroni TaxID=285 RepID=UPI0023AA9387|nr:hypothetical protein [Comamonas testosteroni]WEE79471.1 hypothetical protein LZ683_08960 [Comamonas testosteroni]